MQGNICPLWRESKSKRLFKPISFENNLSDHQVKLYHSMLNHVDNQCQLELVYFTIIYPWF